MDRVWKNESISKKKAKETSEGCQPLATRRQKRTIENGTGNQGALPVKEEKEYRRGVGR